MGIDLNPINIKGNWDDGYSLDHHTLSSVMTGYNAFGHPEFSTKRSAIGELVYRLKYKSDSQALDPIVKAASAFIKEWGIRVELLVPVPPSNVGRNKQPVMEIAKLLSKASGLTLCEHCIQKIKRTTQLKDEADSDKKAEMLKKAFEVSSNDVASKRILLFDDLYDSGTTMNTIAKELKKHGALTVYVLTLTKTRG